MTDDERKRWGLLVSMHKVRPETTAQAQLSDCILAADAELAALRGEVERLREDLEICKEERNGLVADVFRCREAGRKFREAIGGDYQKDGNKVTCIVLMESFAEFDEAFRR